MSFRAAPVCTTDVPDSREAGAIRKLIYGVNVTLDGYIAAPGDDLGWGGPSDELFQWWLRRGVGDRAVAVSGASCGRR